jgi:hypothetical protein
LCGSFVFSKETGKSLSAFERSRKRTPFFECKSAERDEEDGGGGRERRRREAAVQVWEEKRKVKE